MVQTFCNILPVVIQVFPTNDLQLVALSNWNHFNPFRFPGSASS